MAQGVRMSRNARLNQRAWERMTVAQRETGMTGEQLTAIQRRLREAFYSRNPQLRVSP